MALQDCSGDVHMAATSRSLQKDADDFANLPCLQLHIAYVNVRSVDQHIHMWCHVSLLSHC